MKKLTEIIKEKLNYVPIGRYAGRTEFGDYEIVCARKMDCTIVEHQFFENALIVLGGEGEFVQVCRLGHWMIGYIDVICVKPGTDKHEIARTIEHEKQEIEQ